MTTRGIDSSVDEDASQLLLYGHSTRWRHIAKIFVLGLMNDQGKRGVNGRIELEPL